MSEIVCIPHETLAPCDHEEADTRMILYLADVVNAEFHKFFLCTVDVDILTLAVAAVR